MNARFSSPLGSDIGEHLQRIDNYLYAGLLPLWREHAIDREHGGFHERLEQDLKPRDCGYKRLLVQCRQIYVFSHAYINKGQSEDLEAAQQAFDFLCEHYLDKQYGGWYFSVSPDGRVHDSNKDAYGHAFVLFALAYYYRAFKDEKALALAADTRECLQIHLRDEQGLGYHEACKADWSPIPAIRRQNPHMHLLEAFVALYQSTEGAEQQAYAKLCDEMLLLFKDYFFDPRTQTLGEFFDPGWIPHQSEGEIIEAGHHYEWYWLLRDYQPSRDDARLSAMAEGLFNWAQEHGHNEIQGGIHNQLKPCGQIIDDSKRIWPVTECLKALSIRFEQKGEEKDKRSLLAMLDYLFAHYLLEDGRWHEYLNADNSPKDYDLPGSTGYHLFLGLSEAARVLAR